MKRIYTALFGLLAMVTISCTKEDVPAVETISPVGEKITVTAYVGGNDTRVSSSFDGVNQYTFTWDDEDAFSVIGNNENQLFAKVDDNDNHFTGIAPAAKNGMYYAIYPATTAKDHTAATFDISNQSNGAAYVLYSSTEDIGTFGFKHAMAYLRLSFTFPSTPQSSACDITIFTPSGLSTNGTINLSNNGKLTHNQNGKHVIEVKNHTVANPVLVAIPPMEKGVTLNFSVKCGDGNYYRGTLTSTNNNGIEPGKYYDAEVELAQDVPYLTFTATGSQTLKYDINSPEGYQSKYKSLVWSTDKVNWSYFTEAETPVEFGGNIRLYVKANPEAVNSGGTVYAVDNSTGNETVFGRFVFGNSTKVACTGDIRSLIAGDDNLANTTTQQARFGLLFLGCSQLTSVPDLPATTLADLCYKQMFQNCTSLTYIPQLPAIQLSKGCYQQMFEGCTGLTKVPAFSVVNLAEQCYYMMFRGCSNLISAPELPVTELAKGCYNKMFDNCTSLTKAPELPAENLEQACYQGMFYGCTNLINARVLPVTTLAQSCYSSMFQGCTSLVNAPALPATTLAMNCYSYMFQGCTSLTEAPELPAENLEQACYQNMFSGCTSLINAPVLPATTLVQSCYNSMFKDCTSLVNAPALPATTLAMYCYSCMFQGCTSLVNAPALPAETLVTSCYSYMFKGCTSLVKAPVLPAITLVSRCYEYMFDGCTKLNSINAMFNTKPSTDYTSYWVRGVSSNGTFFKNTTATWDSDLTRGYNTVPSGWNIIPASN